MLRVLTELANTDFNPKIPTADVPSEEEAFLEHRHLASYNLMTPCLSTNKCHQVFVPII